MLTSYLVACPHPACDWRGSLLPCRNTEAWSSLIPTTRVAVFECPNCGTQWRAEIVGDDVKPLPVEEWEPHLV
jgi:hypothetical protein